MINYNKIISFHLFFLEFSEIKYVSKIWSKGNLDLIFYSSSTRKRHSSYSLRDYEEDYSSHSLHSLRINCISRRSIFFS